MAKLHQILAVEADIRNQTQKDLTAAHHGLQKAEMLMGLNRAYLPVKEDGDRLPPEGNLLQTRVPRAIQETQDILTKMFDITATRDWANTKAIADVVVGGVTLVKDAPAPFLLWLEKRLVDIHTFVTKLPTLPADTEWEWDANQMCYRNAREIKTHRAIKVEDFKVVVPATPQHPAQIAKLTKDELAGYWTTIKYSGAIKVEDVAAMKARVELLMKEVKFAREKANQVEVTDISVGGGVMKYIFG
jgi:hypothetical protein